MKRDSTCNKDGYLTLKLQDGQLVDSKGRVGYIASNYQFQFDQPPQENANTVGGYSACKNGSLALGDSSVFYQCLSGNFYNLYDRSWAAQCQPILIDMLPCNKNTSPPQDHSPPSYDDPVSQIGDGQAQAPSATTRVPISQISDGQPQAPTATQVPVSQIGDGQPQASSATQIPVSQIGDGQPQASSATPAPPAPSAPLSYSLSTPSGSPVTQISDGQPQAPPATLKTSPVASASNPTTSSAQNTSPSVPITAGGCSNKASSFGVLIFAAAAFFLQ